MTQPEAVNRAIKLALRLECAGQSEAAAELRRLHELNTELLAALNKACLWHSNPKQWLDQAYAAIYRSEGEAK